MIGKLFSQTELNDTALIIIDIQEFYFAGGKLELIDPEIAAGNAKLLLEHFRKNHLRVIHIRHKYEPGGEIHKTVEPIEPETIINKNDINCFKDTELLKILKDNSIKTIVVCGMQTHMCVEACVRAASDFGYNVVLVEDACATRSLKYNDYEIRASDVHYSTLATLKNYARITDTKSILREQKID